MGVFVEGEDRTQLTLLPECLDDWVGEDNAVHVGNRPAVIKFGDQLFHGILGIAPAFAPEIAVEARRVPGPVGQFVDQRAVIAFGIAEGFEGIRISS